MSSLSLMSRAVRFGVSPYSLRSLLIPFRGVTSLDASVTPPWSPSVEKDAIGWSEHHSWDRQMLQMLSPAEGGTRALVVNWNTPRHTVCLLLYPSFVLPEPKACLRFCSG